MLDTWEITHVDADLNPETWAFLKKHRFFGMIIPKEYGGLGFSALAHRAVLQKIASVCGVTASTVAVPNSLGPGELLLEYGTEEQKNHYLPRLARGEEIPCFGLTGPTAGSDATSIPDFGIVCKQKVKGKDVLGIRMTFDKRYITLAPIATLVGIAFRMYDPDGLLASYFEDPEACSRDIEVRATRHALAEGERASVVRSCRRFHMRNPKKRPLTAKVRALMDGESSTNATTTRSTIAGRPRIIAATRLRRVRTVSNRPAAKIATSIRSANLPRA